MAFSTYLSNFWAVSSRTECSFSRWYFSRKWKKCLLLRSCKSCNLSKYTLLYFGYTLRSHYWRSCGLLNWQGKDAEAPPATVPLSHWALNRSLLFLARFVKRSLFHSCGANDSVLNSFLSLLAQCLRLVSQFHFLNFSEFCCSLRRTSQRTL